MFAAPLALALASLAQQPAAELKEAAFLARQPLLEARGKGGFGKRKLEPINIIPVSPGTPSLLASTPPGGDEAVLKNVKIDPTDAGLLNFFKKRTPPAP